MNGSSGKCGPLSIGKRGQAGALVLNHCGDTPSRGQHVRTSMDKLKQPKQKKKKNRKRGKEWSGSASERDTPKITQNNVHETI